MQRLAILGEDMNRFNLIPGVLLLTRQSNISVSAVVCAPAASFDNAACRRTHDYLSLKKQSVGGNKHGPSLRCGSWQGGKPFPASRALIRAMLVLLRPIYLVAGLMMFSAGSAIADSNPGDSCGPDQVYDCTMACVNISEAYGWSGDGYCDDGEWGVVLTCPAFNNDGGDCEAPPLTAPGSPCGDGLLYDCSGNCVDAVQAHSWVGDGYCDDGSWELVLTCPAFDNDGGDCPVTEPEPVLPLTEPEPLLP